MIKIFLSHSSRDATLANLVIDLIRAALVGVSSEDIRCTSVPGYKLPGGARTDDQLRQELLEAPVFVGLITESGLDSSYVLFELGARWGTGKEMIPLLAPGISPSSLEGPISAVNALSCASQSDLHQLVAQIAAALNATCDSPAAYQSKIELVTLHPPVSQASQRRESVAPQAAVDALAELRSEGIHEILNRRVNSEDESKQLRTYTDDWWQRVVAVLEQDFTKAEQLNFARLGAVPLVRFPHAYDPRHDKILREFALQERRLLDIIARHTR